MRKQLTDYDRRVRNARIRMNLKMAFVNTLCFGGILLIAIINGVLIAWFCM